MNYRQFLDLVAKGFLQQVETFFLLQSVDTEDFEQYLTDGGEWKNYRYSSYKCRMAHVERYSDDKVHVLHFTTFPRDYDAAPIFGFDVVATDKKVLGCYFDLSPVLTTWGDCRNYSRRAYDQLMKEIFQPFDEHFPDRRPVPEWAEDIFSERACFLEPKNDLDVAMFCHFSLNAYRTYVDCLDYDTRERKDRIVSIQNRYCEVQAKNPRTFSVLKSKIGEEKARYFMEEILFPKIKN